MMKPVMQWIHKNFTASGKIQCSEWLMLISIVNDLRLVNPGTAYWSASLDWNTPISCSEDSAPPLYAKPVWKGKGKACHLRSPLSLLIPVYKHRRVSEDLHRYSLFIIQKCLHVPDVIQRLAIVAINAEDQHPWFILPLKNFKTQNAKLSLQVKLNIRVGCLFSFVDFHFLNKSPLCDFFLITLIHAVNKRTICITLPTHFSIKLLM